GSAGPASEPAHRTPQPIVAASPEIVAAAEDEAARASREHGEMLDREYPLHGLVTKTQIVVRMRAEPESAPLGWLRIGAHVRLRAEPQRTPTCASGWYELHPRGFACAGQGIDVGEAPPEAAAEIAPDLESA